MWCRNSLLEMHKLCFLVVVFLSVLNFSHCDTCEKQNSCECVFTNGSVIDLTSIGYHHKARFENFKATEKKDNYTYFYNPCYSFELGKAEPSKSEDCSKGVAACQVLNKDYYNIGDPEPKFELDNNGKVLKLLYSSAFGRSTNVTLVCSEDAETPKLTVVGEKTTMHYEMILTTKCACPDLCRISHLSTGSILVIIFMIFVLLYLFLGIVHSSLTRGAHGWELLPHYEFWADFPLLVRDGCVFVVNGCKAETAYERI